MTATQSHDLPQPNSETTISSDLQDQIRTRAYEIYEQRGRQDGSAEEDWLKAEAEILARESAAREAQASAAAREKVVAFTASRRQDALSRAARRAEKARPHSASV